MYPIASWHINYLLILKEFASSMHRISKNNKNEVLGKAEQDLAVVRDQYVSRLVKELQGTDFWKLRRSYSPGVGSPSLSLLLC